VNDREVVVFDVNETLLDLTGLTEPFSAIMPVELMGLWFTRMLHNSLVANATGRYDSFDRQGVDALIVTAGSVGVTLSEANAADFVAELQSLPPHPDAVPALERLAESGYRLATLTNSSLSVLEAQMGHAGLRGFFDELISVEEVQQFKPAPATYLYAAGRLRVQIDGMRLVAAHSWDVTGAARAGAKTAFVSRGTANLGPLSETPDIVGDDLISVAESIVAGAGMDQGG
jgi:2-haloacid dehalogenase